jgi:hypothetical protein
VGLRGGYVQIVFKWNCENICQLVVKVIAPTHKCRAFIVKLASKLAINIYAIRQYIMIKRHIIIDEAFVKPILPGNYANLCCKHKGPAH